MESQDELNENIRLITIKIQKENPELIKYINEIPRGIPLKKEEKLNKEALKDYLDSLNNILKTYAKEH
ncbi:hypothetical protein [uncultured Formosa sp.]|uniref:hypothetical protein n=1 Tax=uncultured Formosa sp. TaxID=255435 RepID=UPI0026394361|nr:hypothetical protein [uncultured Formosa sp.]